MTSSAILYGDDARMAAAVRPLLEPCGWAVHATSDAAVAVARLDDTVALLMLDARAAGAAALLADIRARPHPAASVPVLQWGGAGLPAMGAPAPDDGAALAAAIAHVTGALSDHALRRMPHSPFYRLVRLLGTEDAVAMIDRFAGTMRAALTAPVITPDLAHRLAGIAGAIGYPDLGRAWGAAEHGGAYAIERAMAASRATLAVIERGDVARYRDLGA
ncbi:hypothetical protein [Sphingomonas sp. NFR15]|uniref:hypothetical protein n=1 Tax=Sphingomonas sp. NFR15 TaxID=1566282 RepID=UPI000890C8A9|nr:hypothetical protein [Sphingomonas sp. NFR15]SDA35143.1 hypothetical protein SAMN03159340_03182 [Sphingomonas sp. NFR15]